MSWEEDNQNNAAEDAENDGYGFPAQETMPARFIRATFSRIALGLFFMLLIQQAVGLAIVYIIDAFAPALAEADWFFWAVSYLPLYLVAYPVMLSVWRSVPNRMAGIYQIRKLPLRAYFPLLAGCYAVVYIINIISTLVAHGISAATGNDIVNPLQSVLGAGNLWLNLAVVVLVAPVMEEIIFRRFLYNKLACYGGGVYVFFSAALFASFHLNLFQMLYAFILGAVFASITFYTGTIRHSILLHMMVNLLGAGGMPLIIRYMGETGYLVIGLFAGLMLVLGVMAIVKWHRAGSPWMDFPPGRYQMPSLIVMIANPGVIAYIILVAAFTILSMAIS